MQTRAARQYPFEDRLLLSVQPLAHHSTLATPLSISDSANDDHDESQSFRVTLGMLAANP